MGLRTNLEAAVCFRSDCRRVPNPFGATPGVAESWKKGKDPDPQDKIQHLDFTKDPRPLYYKTPPCSMPNMTGRPGHWTMEMNGGSSAPYLACTPCVPLFVHCLIRVEAEGLLDYKGRAGIISIVRWNLRPVIFGTDLCILAQKSP